MDVECGGLAGEQLAGEASEAHILGRPSGLAKRSKSPPPEVSLAGVDDEIAVVARSAPKVGRARTPIFRGSSKRDARSGSKTKARRMDKQLHGKIKAFQDERETERRLMFRAVVRLSLRVLALGVPLSALGAILKVLSGVASEWDSVRALEIAGFSVSSLGFSTSSIGVVIGSCCPYDLFDFDDVCRKSPRNAGAVAICCFILSALKVGYFPHLDAPKILFTLMILVTFFLEACGLHPPRSWPTVTALTAWFLIFDGFSGGGIFLAPEQNSWLPIPEDCSNVIGYVHVSYGVTASAGWFWHRWHYADLHHGHSVRFIMVLYSWFIVAGLWWALYGAMWMVYPKKGSEDAVAGALELALGISMMLPSLAVLLVGRERFFKRLGRSFDKDGARLRRDGAFVAELLETVPVEIGQTWWAHREMEDESYPPFDPRRCWQKGVVTELTDQTDFAVGIQGDPSGEVTTVKVQLPTAGKGESKEDLLLRAQRDLRCVEFENLSPDLMYRVDSRNKPELQAAWHALSRPVRPGERIDYFMSNSWYDNPETKWEKLVEVAEKFHNVHARYPTFWLDKLCIDQQQISDGLKVLPVNVMACNKLLALCGDTYLSRLWCIWELFTLFAFVDETAALNRIKFVFLGRHEEGMIMLDGMANFHVNTAHCYDPNEEARLLKVIDAVGTARFNARISNMASMTKARMEKWDNQGNRSARRTLRSTARAWWRSWSRQMSTLSIRSTVSTTST